MGYGKCVAGRSKRKANEHAVNDRNGGVTVSDGSARDRKQSIARG